MSKILGYIGQIPLNDDVIKLAKQYDNIGFCNEIGISRLNSSDLTVQTHINTLIAKENKAPKISESYIICGLNGLTNIDNLNLPFNIFRNPKDIDELLLGTIEYLKSSSNGIIKSLNKNLIGDLTIMFYDKDNDAIYCQMGANPIVIGLGDKFSIISNSIDAINNITSKFILLQSGDKAKITRDKITIYNSKNRKIKKSIYKSNENKESEYNYYLQEALFTLASSVSSLITNATKNDKLSYNKLKINKMNARAFNKIVIVSDLESYYAAECSKKIFTVLCNIEVEAHLSCEYVRENKTIDSDVLFIGISLNGEDTTLNQCISYAKKSRARVIGITSQANSYLARLCDYIIKTPKQNNNREYNFSLNTFCLSYLSLTFFALYFGNLNGTVSDVYMDVAIKMVQMLPSKIAQSAKTPSMNELYKSFILNSDNIIFTGSGIDYSLARHINTLFPRLSRTPTSAYSIFELDSQYISPSTLIISVITNKDYLFEFKESLKIAHKKGAKILVVTNCNIENSLSDFENIICVSDSLPIYNTLPTLAYLYSLAINCNKSDNQNEKSVAI